jgi:hypothetical protein
MHTKSLIEKIAELPVMKDSRVDRLIEGEMNLGVILTIMSLWKAKKGNYRTAFYLLGAGTLMLMDSISALLVRHHVIISEKISVIENKYHAISDQCSTVDKKVKELQETVIALSQKKKRRNKSNKKGGNKS